MSTALSSLDIVCVNSCINKGGINYNVALFMYNDTKESLQSGDCLYVGNWQSEIEGRRQEVVESRLTSSSFVDCRS